MIRECEHIISSNDGKRAIYIDKKNKEEILAYLQQDKRHRKKFRYITDIILGGHKNTDVYDKEDINEQCKDVTAMKFFKGQENDRIYCKEIKSKEGTKIVVTAVLHKKKKSQKNTQKEKTIIQQIANYQYEV